MLKLAVYVKCFRIFLQLVLLAIMIYFFGWSDLQKYQAMNTFLTSQEVGGSATRSPAITVCPTNPGTDFGFRKEVVVGEDDEVEVCTEAGNITACLEEETFNLSEAVLGVKKGFERHQVEYENGKDWIAEFSFFLNGRCHTFNSSLELELRFTKGALRLELNSSLHYYVFIHDLDYYVTNMSPFGVPGMTFLTITKDSGAAYYEIQQVQKNNIIGCNSHPDYKFTACVKETLSRLVDLSSLLSVLPGG